MKNKNILTIETSLGRIFLSIIKDNNFFSYAIDSPRSIQPTARRGKVLPKNLQDDDESDDEDLENIKEVLNPQEQRVLAAHCPRIGISNMPDGWTKEKILKAFNAPELEGYRMQWID